MIGAGIKTVLIRKKIYARGGVNLSISDHPDAANFQLIKILRMSILETVILYVADKIAAQIIKDEVWTKRIKHFFWPPKKYKTELQSVINETIQEYEKTHPYTGSSLQFPFYHSQILFESLSKYILFETVSQNGIAQELAENKNIKSPTDNELNDFYTLLTDKIKANETLKSLFIEENYKQKIFSLASVVDEMKATLNAVSVDTSATRAIVESLHESQKAKQLNEASTIDALQKQVWRQLKKQISSGKYLQDTFIETGDHKDYLRFICDSLFYSKLYLEEIAVLDFRHLNRLLAAKAEPAFTFSIADFEERVGQLDHSNVASFFSELSDLLDQKRKEITELPLSSNDKSSFEYKFTDPAKTADLFQSRIALITESAGQGKTNFLCDFVENFLLKRAIPAVFLTGTDIRPDNIRASILSKVFPDSEGLSFSDMLQQLNKTCKDQKKFFVIIIDGLNENVNPSLFSKNLESFITEMLEYDFIRIVLSCRTEYYQKNFRNLEKAEVKDDLFILPSLLRHHQDRDPVNEKLFHTYFRYFKVAYKSVGNKVFNQLSRNFLLLRIFCETYQGHEFDRIDNIYKEELFENYFTLKCNEINKRFQDNDDFLVKGNFDIRNFITDTITWMIQNKTYVNVPLDSILKNDDNRNVYVRFLDENILVRRDIQTSSAGLFAETELVNFTFDEFRDFLLSRYMMNEMYNRSEAEFESFLTGQLNEKSPILEGCSTFLFYVSRKKGDPKLHEIISRQWWYPSVFSDCIFNVKDDEITAADKDSLKNYFLNESKDNRDIIFSLITRFDTHVYKSLNLDFLFDMLLELEEETYNKMFSSYFTTSEWDHDRINQKALIKQLADILEKDQLIDQHPEYHKAFEMLLYMFDLKDNWEIQNLYERYFYQHKETAGDHLRRALQTRNESLLAELNLFIENYEIRL